MGQLFRRLSKYRIAIGISILLALNSLITLLLPTLLPHFVRTLQCTLPQASFTATLGTVLAFLFSLSGMKLASRIPPRWALLTGSIAAACIALIYSGMRSLWALYSTGVLTGIVMAFGMNATCASLLQAHYPHRGAPLISIVFGSASIFSAGLLFLLSRLHQHYSWDSILFVLGLVLLGSGVLCNLLLLRHTTAPAPTRPQPIATPAAPLRKPAALFLLGIFFASTLHASVGMFLSSYWQAHGVSPSTSAGYNSLFTFAGSLVMLFCGFVQQKAGPRRFLGGMFACFSLGIFCLLAWPRLQAAWFTVLSILLLCTARPSRTLPAMLIPRILGNASYARDNFMGMSAYYIGSALSMQLTSGIISHTGSFTPALLLLVLFAVLACALLLHCLKYPAISE